MKVLIADDEPLARDRLAALLQEIGGHEVVATVGTGIEALAAVEAGAPDVVLLDIRMPRMDGLEAARHLSILTPAPAVIFTTAYGDHALAAFDAQAIDYLVKPIRLERLAQALSRAQAVTRTRIEPLLGAAAARSHLSGMLRGRMVLVPIGEVRCLQADSKYVSVLWPDGELLIDESLKALEEEFRDTFLRVHRNALVAVEHVAALAREGEGELAVVLRGVTARVPVSRRLHADVRRRLRGLG